VVSWSRIARRSRVPLGFAVAVLYFWLADPIPISLSAGALFIIPGLMIRALASGHVEKNQRLATTGPYAYTRNPLYLGSFIMATGFAFAARSWWFVVILVVMLVAIYLPVIRAEEAFLAQHFPDFGEYARRVPRLLPTFPSPKKQRWEFSWNLYKKHREYNATLGSVAIMAALVIKMQWLSR
jgi:protein-S-isoprenylcysteine O-methyltransferase Ste14